MSNNRSQQNNGGEPRNGAAGLATRHKPDPKSAPRPRSLTTVVLDRDPIWSQAVEQVLERLHINVVGKTNSPERALALIAERKPDLLIAEIETGVSEIDGIACLRQARARAPDLKTIVFSRSDDREQILAAFSAGALAYVHKKTHPDDLAMAIRQLVLRALHPSRRRRDHQPAETDAALSSPDRDPPACRRRAVNCRHGEEAVGNRTDGQVPPWKHLPKARRVKPDRGCPRLRARLLARSTIKLNFSVSLGQKPTTGRNRRLGPTWRNGGRVERGYQGKPEDRRYRFFRGATPSNESSRPGGERKLHIVRFIEGAHHEHARRGNPRANAASRLDRIEGRHLQTHEDDVGQERGRELDRFLAVACTTDDLNALLGAERPHQLPHEQTVPVGEENSDRTGGRAARGHLRKQGCRTLGPPVKRH